MKNLIYLAGAMTGLADEGYVWRKDFSDNIDECGTNWVCVNPVEHFSTQSIYDKAEYKEDLDRIAMNIDLDKLRHSSLVVCDFEHQDSIGTSCELAIAHEMNIPIIGVCTKEQRNTLHPWWELFATVIVDNYDKALIFIIDHYIND